MRYFGLILIFTLITSCKTDFTQMTREIDSAMLDFVAQKKISGAVTLAVHDGEIIHFSPVGMANIEKGKKMNKESLFRIASLSKNFTAAALMTLQDSGKVDVYDKVEKYIPEFKGVKLKEEDGKGAVDLRIWHLMSHTSGVSLPRIDTMPSLKDAASQMSRLPLKFRPGSQWKYSRGLDAVARIIEVASGMSFEDYLAKKITGPMGLKDTAFSINEEQGKRLVITYVPGKNGAIIPSTVPRLITAPGPGTKPVPSGGLISSTADIGAFYTMLLNKGMHKGKRILSEEAVMQLTTSVTGDKKAGFVPGSAWGMGFGLVKEPQGVTAMLNPGTFGHGGAYGTQAWVDPVTKTVYILMIQRTKFGNSDASDIRGKFQEIVAKWIKE